MACYSPLSGYRSEFPNGSGKFPVVFSPGPRAYELVLVPCGQCIGCRLERSRQWAVRCVHEASLYDANSFVTFTYDKIHLPYDGSLNKDHFVLFMKRLRFWLSRSDETVRFYMCGEYGDDFGRPHYHALLFGLDFPDKVLWSEEDGTKLYRSPMCERLWRFGMCIIGEVNFDSAGYVARYCMKKVTGKDSEDFYWKYHQGFDLMIAVESEYSTMSRRPGLGNEWLDCFSEEVFEPDEVIVNGHPCSPPRYYTDIYSVVDPEGYEVMKEKRKRASWDSYYDNSPARLVVREKCKEAQVGLLSRSL